MAGKGSAPRPKSGAGEDLQARDAKRDIAAEILEGLEALKAVREYVLKKRASVFRALADSRYEAALPGDAKDSRSGNDASLRELLDTEASRGVPEETREAQAGVL